MTGTLQQATHSRRVGARLDRHAHYLQTRKAPLDTLPGSWDAALLEYLAAVGVQETQVTVAITEIDTGSNCCDGGTWPKPSFLWACCGPTTSRWFIVACAEPSRPSHPI